MSRFQVTLIPADAEDNLDHIVFTADRRDSQTLIWCYWQQHQRPVTVEVGVLCFTLLKPIDWDQDKPHFDRMTDVLF